jgi:hypothetical protein
MMKRVLVMLTGLIVIAGAGYSYTWTAPVEVTNFVPDRVSGAFNVTPNSEAVQRTVSFTNQVRVLFNRNPTTLGGPFPYIFEALSTNGGGSWTSWDQVYGSPTSLSQYSPSLVKVGNVLHATWYEDNGLGWAQIFYARSADFGATWSVYHPTEWNWQFFASSNEFPHLAVSSNGQQVVIVWKQDYQYGPLVRVWSLDGGLTWNSGGPTQIYPPDPQSAYLSNVTYTPWNGGRFIAVYSKYGTSPKQIYSTFSINGGVSWSLPQPVLTISANRDFPAVVANQNYVMCVWQYPAVLLSSSLSTDGGASWQLERSFYNSWPPNDGVVTPWQSLAYDPCSGDFLCTWASLRSGGQKVEIYVSEYTTYWPSPTQVSSSASPYPSHGPRVSAYPKQGGWTRFITFSNGPDQNNLSVWESQSGCIPAFGEGGGQSKGAVQRPDVVAPMVRAMPNPASSFVRLSYFLGESVARRSLRIYSVTGHLVKVLDLEASVRDLRWDLKDERGNPVPNGVYYLRLEGTGVPIGERLVVLR